MVRYIANVFPTLEAPSNSPTPNRVAPYIGMLLAISNLKTVIYHLLKNIPDLVTAQTVKLALVYDWLFYYANGSEARLHTVEPLARLISDPRLDAFPGASVLDFLRLNVEHYLPSHTHLMRRGVADAMQALVASGAVSRGDVTGDAAALHELFPGLLLHAEPESLDSPPPGVVWPLQAGPDALSVEVSRYVHARMADGTGELLYQDEAMLALAEGLSDTAVCRDFLYAMYKFNRRPGSGHKDVVKNSRNVSARLLASLAFLGVAVEARLLSQAICVDTRQGDRRLENTPGELKWIKYMLGKLVMLRGEKGEADFSSEEEEKLVRKARIEEALVSLLTSLQTSLLPPEFYPIAIEAFRCFPEFCVGNIAMLKLLFGMCDPSSVCSLFL